MADSDRRYVEQDWAESNPSGVVAPDTGTQTAGYGAVKPPYQEHNWLFQLMTNMLQYMEQNGIIPWKLEVNYSLKSLTFGSDGVVYQSQVENNQGTDPTTDSGANWLPWLETTDNPFNAYTVEGGGTALATTTYDAGSSKAQDGYTTLPNGLMLQWGRETLSSQEYTINFPTSFTVSPYIIVGTKRGANAQGNMAVETQSTTSFSGNTSGTGTYDWIAIGR